MTNDQPLTLIIGSSEYLREDYFKLRKAEEDTFVGLMRHASTCPICKKSGLESLTLTDPSKLCPQGKGIWAEWSENSLGLEKLGKARKPRKRQFGNARPQQVEKKHPHKGPVCIKKDPGGRCLKWDKFKPGRKAKPKKSKVRWK